MVEYEHSRLPFREAIAFFQSKVSVDTDSWRDIQGIEHRAVFAVASAKGALLDDLRKAVDAAITDGESLAQFRKRFDQIVAARGWDYRGGRDWRSRLILETNLRSAYRSGREEQIEQVKSRRPYGLWRHGGSREPRPIHKALDGKVFPLSDPIWAIMGGFGCKCTKFTLSDRDIARLGLEVESAPSLGSKYQGQVVGPDPGWAAPQARPSAAERARLIQQVGDRLGSEAIRTQTLLEMLSRFTREELEEMLVAAEPGGDLAELIQAEADEIPLD